MNKQDAANMQAAFHLFRKELESLASEDTLRSMTELSPFMGIAMAQGRTGAELCFTLEGILEGIRTCLEAEENMAGQGEEQ